MLLGIYKNYDDLEASLSIEELNRMIAQNRRNISEDRRFTAALKGIKLDSAEDIEDKELRQAVERRAAAKAKGMSEEEYNDKMDMMELQEIAGIRMESD